MKLHLSMVRVLPHLLSVVVLASGLAWAEPPNTNHQIYNFERQPFINPKIIQELSTWISDGGDQVVSIDINSSQNSNRFFSKHDPKIINRDDSKNSNPWVFINDDNDNEGFGYRYIGKTESGVHLLHTYDWPGGSGKFMSVMVITMEMDSGGIFDEENTVFTATRSRLLLKKIGSIPLGDRWSGELTVEGNNLVIGNDTGPASGTKNGGQFSEAPRETVIKIDIN